MTRWLSLLPPLVLAAGCAPTGDDDRFPSLLPRAIESRDEAVRAPEPAPAAPDAALDAQLQEMRGRFQAAAIGFDTDYDEALRLAQAARGADPGSVAWLDAQVALAGLDVARTDTRLLIADLEQLAIDRAVELKPPYPALTALVAETETQLARQAERIAVIEGLLAPALTQSGGRSSFSSRSSGRIVA